MTPEEKEELKVGIVARIADIQANMKSLKETAKPVAPDNAIGRLTRMDAMQIQKMQEVNLKTALNNIEKLKESLTKIDEDSFGQCPYCKQMIGFERLKALPESNMCIECAERYGG